MAESTHLSNTRERPRSRSAKARLTPSGPESTTFAFNKGAITREDVLKEAKERAKSAKLIRGKHTASTQLFPSQRSSKERFTSMYSTDYDGTFASPPDLRPTSPTRRNNPHPAKQFMVWRLPSRDIGGIPYEEGLELPPEYVTRNPEFDAIDELSRNFDSVKLPLPRPTSSDYGAYLHRQKKKQLDRERALGGDIYQPKTVLQVGNDIFRRTVANENQEALSEWMKTASPDEQHTVLKMLKSAEASQVNDTISNVMKPGAAKAVQSWMQDADEKERDVAVRLFSSLGSRPMRGVRQRSFSESDSRPPSRKLLLPSESQVSQSRLMMGAPSNGKKKSWPTGIWHHKPVRDHPPQVYHRGALFGGIRGGASHFTIHPEWPDYYGPQHPNTGDIVH